MKNFGDALTAVKNGTSAKREAWDEGARIGLFEENGVKMVGWGSDDHPVQVYHPTASDLLAEDWETI